MRFVIAFLCAAFGVHSASAAMSSQIEVDRAKGVAYFRDAQRKRWLVVLLASATMLLGTTSSFSSSLATASSNGVAWLSQQRNIDDGSWSATSASDPVKYVQTSEAVLALEALNQMGPAYYGGVAWLGNHASTNTDFTARAILALGAANQAVSYYLQVLQSAQNLSAPGNNGFGVSGNYQGSPLDTSLSLQALTQQSITANVSQAISYLLATQLVGSDTGWALGQEASSDPVTTAQVLIALIPLKSVNGAVPAAVTNGLVALNAKVTAVSPVYQIALAVIANLRNNPNSTQGATLLNALLAQQAGDGSWGDDVFATGLALRAVAAGAGSDLMAQKQAASVTDNALRGAINAALGHGALDTINIGQLQQLVTLDISSRGISDLSGLQYATNLVSLNAQDNKITSLTPLASLNNLTKLILTNNPLGPGDSDGDGFSDVEESLFGTNPLNAADHPVFKDASTALNLRALITTNTDVGHVWDGWHPLWENFAGQGLLDLVTYFNGADEFIGDISCASDCGGNAYTGPAWGVLTVLENVNGSYVQRALLPGQEKMSGEIVNMYAFDYDNDGKKDLLLVLHPVYTDSYDPYNHIDPASHRNLVLFRNDTGEAGVPAGLHFTDVTAAVGLPTGAQTNWVFDTSDAVILDSDQDGYLDIVSMNWISARLWRFNSATHQYQATTPLGLTPTNIPKPIALDLDGDGKADIVAVGASELEFYKNNGNGSFTKLTNNGSTAQFGGYTGVEINKIVPVDYNRDSKVDLALFHTQIVSLYGYNNYGGGYVRLLKNTSAGGIINFAEDAATNLPLPSNTIATPNATVLNFSGTVGDYDNDMNVDLLIANRDYNLLLSDPYAALYHNSGNGSFADVGVAAGILIRGSSDSFSAPTLADFNGDGKLDLLRPNSIYSRYLLVNGGNTNHSITLDLVGKLSGGIPSSSKDAWGAMVTVTASGIPQTQQLQPLYGKTHRLHFGVGTTTSGIQVTIKWPNGAIQNLSGTTIDSALDRVLQLVQP